MSARQILTRLGDGFVIPAGNNGKLSNFPVPGREFLNASIPAAPQREADIFTRNSRTITLLSQDIRRGLVIYAPMDVKVMPVRTDITPQRRAYGAVVPGMSEDV